MPHCPLLTGIAVIFTNPEFVLSVHHLRQLPVADRPEIAFAGRSNVGKSSLMNTLLGRKSLVKVSGRPGKTQGLNFFRVGGDAAYLVDLPGYGYAKVNKDMKAGWLKLISTYLETRETLRCVVVILDIRHEAKEQDAQLIGWLQQNNIPFLPVYTKIDKLSGNARQKNASRLDAGHTIAPHSRVLFSSKTGQGREQLIEAMTAFL